MEIKCSKSIGGWFDELAIFNVKLNICNEPNKSKNIENFQKLASDIKEGIGLKLFQEIIQSDEYKDLYSANLHTFKKVEQAQKDTGLAKEVDVANHERFKKKNDLQKKFFNSEVKEVKIGY